MRRPGQDADRILEQRVEGEIGVGADRREAREVEVDRPRPEHVEQHLLVGFADRDRGVTGRAQHLRQRLGQDALCPAAAARADPQHLPLAAGNGFQILGRQAQFAEDRAGAANEARRVHRGSHSLRRAVEQRNAQRALEVRDRRGHRRLRQVQETRGLAEAPVLHDGEERAHLPQLDLPAQPPQSFETIGPSARFRDKEF